MKILFLSRWFPSPPDNGSKLRIYSLLRHLSTSHTVDLISFTEGEAPEGDLNVLRGFCRSVQVVPYRPFEPGLWQSLAGFVSWRPRSVIETHSAALETLAAQSSAREAYDLVIASQIDMAPYAATLPARRRVFEEVELTTLYEQYATQRNPLKRLRAWLTWSKLSYYLPRLARSFDGFTVVSEQERARLLALVPGAHAAVAPNGVDCAALGGDFGRPEPGSLLYNGALTYSANYDAVAYFLGEIFPLVRAQHPDARLYVTGRTNGIPLEALPDRTGVTFTGYLRDVRQQVAAAWASVVPLRQGGGTRLKILESLALGTPVIATSKGAEGLDLCPGEEYLRADTPQDFAHAVLRLLDDPDLRQRLSVAGRQAAQRYDWSKTLVPLDRFIDTLGR